MENSKLFILILLAVSVILIGCGIFISSENTSDETVNDDELLDELDDYFIDGDGEIVIGEVEIPDDLTEDDVLDEINEYILDSDEDIDIGSMDDFIE